MWMDRSASPELGPEHAVPTSPLAMLVFDKGLCRHE